MPINENRIDAIKAIREKTGCGLLMAKHSTEMVGINTVEEAVEWVYKQIEIEKGPMNLEIRAGELFLDGNRIRFIKKYNVVEAIDEVSTLTITLQINAVKK